MFHVEHTPIQKLAATRRRAADQLVTGRIQELHRQRAREVSTGSW